MQTKIIELGTKGIKKALKAYKPIEAIAEYIWNGFDATASTVSININDNQIEGIDSIVIMDNGTGIEYKSLESKFKPFLESNKIVNRKIDESNSAFHGKNGVGRLTFFTFATFAKWETVYEENQKKYSYTIEISSDKLNGYTASEIIEVDSNTETCTKVTFEAINEKFNTNEIKKYLSLEFAWYLELMYKNDYKLYFNGQVLDYSSILKERDVKMYHHDEINFEVVFCRWSNKLHNEYSKYYYLDSNHVEKFSQYTTLNNKGDDFYHSVFIHSMLFNDFTFKDPHNQLNIEGTCKNEDDESFKYIKKEVDKLIKEKRNPFIRKHTQTFIKALEVKGVYPSYDKNNIIDMYKKDSLNELISTIYYIEPSMLKTLKDKQLKAVIRMFDLLMNSGEIESFINILEGVLDMTGDERDELSSVLKYTTMSKISKTILLLKDRAQAVADLKELVFNKDLKAGEINAIQPFIEKHYWLFGEQFHLVTAEEPDFVEALRRFIYILHGEKKAKSSIKIDNENSKRQMDIFAVQQMKTGDIKKSIIVELKHPEIKLSLKELYQVKKYLNTIISEERFNAPNIQWEFYLVGNQYKHEIKNELENAKTHGEKSLVYSVSNYKIYVKTWSEIFTEFEINHDFLMEKLELEQAKIISSTGDTKEEILNMQISNSAIRPEEVVV